VDFGFDLLVVDPFQETFRSGRIRTVAAQLRRLQSASGRAIGMMDHAPVQIGRHHILVGFGENGDIADQRRAATNDDGGFIATNGVPRKKGLHRWFERFLHVLRDRVTLACHAISFLLSSQRDSQCVLGAGVPRAAAFLGPRALRGLILALRCAHVLKMGLPVFTAHLAGLVTICDPPPLSGLSGLLSIGGAPPADALSAFLGVFVGHISSRRLLTVPQIVTTPPAGGQRTLPFRAQLAGADQAAREMRRSRHIDVTKILQNP
jgi:hypothetical protein